MAVENLVNNKKNKRRCGICQEYVTEEEGEIREVLKLGVLYHECFICKYCIELDKREKIKNVLICK